jgi:hypothetical protein
MDIAKTLADLNALAGHAGSANRHARGLPPDAFKTWEALPRTLDALVAEAERLVGVPDLAPGLVQTDTKNLKRHLNALISTKVEKGRSAEYHAGEAYAALHRLRLDFGSALNAPAPD